MNVGTIGSDDTDRVRFRTTVFVMQTIERRSLRLLFSSETRCAATGRRPASRKSRVDRHGSWLNAIRDFQLIFRTFESSVSSVDSSSAIVTSNTCDVIGSNRSYALMISRVCRGSFHAERSLHASRGGRDRVAIGTTKRLVDSITALS